MGLLTTKVLHWDLGKSADAGECDVVVAIAGPRRSIVQRNRSAHIWRISLSLGVLVALGNSIGDDGYTFVDAAVIPQRARKNANLIQVEPPYATGWV